ncbi:hypothetical protein JXB01_02975 [Candidatus Micrarchaeota archaeon]|nr:hypothetical protein [Candidatus Micrarchaeota archaeon]
MIIIQTRPKWIRTAKDSLRKANELRRLGDTAKKVRKLELVLKSAFPQTGIKIVDTLLESIPNNELNGKYVTKSSPESGNGFLDPAKLDYETAILMAKQLASSQSPPALVKMTNEAGSPYFEEIEITRDDENHRAVSLLTVISASLTQFDLTRYIQASEFEIRLGIRLLELDAFIRKTKGKRRVRYLREKISLVYKDALEMLKAQSRIETEKRKKPAGIKNENEYFFSESSELSGGRCIGDEAEYLRNNFPGLCGIVKKHEILERRAELSSMRKRRDTRRKKIKGLQSLYRESISLGVPAEFAVRMINAGTRDSWEIFESIFETENGDSRSPGMACTAEPIQRKTAASPVSDTSRTFELERDVLRAVEFNSSVKEKLSYAGISEYEIVCSLCKGFGFGTPKCKAGGYHLRGSIVRKNMRRSGINDPETVLDFLKKQDLIIECGSSASTRTKDDAMSINTNPQSDSGREIITAIQRKFIELRVMAI